MVDLRPRIDRDYKHCYNSTTNSGRLLANPGRGTSLVSRHAVRARPFRNFPPPHTSLSLSAMPLVVFPLGSGCPRRLLRPHASVVATFVSASSAPRPCDAAGSPPLPDSSNRYVHSQIAPLPRRLGRLVLWLFFFYVHHCKLVVCLAAVVDRSDGPFRVVARLVLTLLRGRASLRRCSPCRRRRWLGRWGGPWFDPRCVREAARTSVGP